MIIEGLQSLATPLEKLKTLPGNPRKGDVQSVMKSYETFGQRKPIVARKDGTVIAGNHQLEAAKQLGWTEIAVVFVDDDDKTAKAFALADNRTHDLGTYDDNALADLLNEINEIDKDLYTATGYSNEYLDELLLRINSNSPSEMTPEELKAQERGALLALASVTIGEPEHKVENKSVYQIGEHYLIVCDVMRDWPMFIHYLDKQGPKALFMPYAGPYVAISSKLKEKKAVLVQPDLYLAGHILDKWSAIFGEDSVKRVL